MKIGLAQINTTVGDLEGNVERCLAAIETARRQNADLVVLPEMAIPGYPPRDILFDASFIEAVQAATTDLACRAGDGPPAIAGTVTPADYGPPRHPGLSNAAVLIENGSWRQVTAKRLLPAYDVFFEPRWFVPGAASSPVTIAGQRVGVLICEDAWDEGYLIHPAADLRAAGAELLVCLSASPYRQQVMAERYQHLKRHQCPLVYVNLVGATDELIFDGRSLAVDEKGQVLTQLPAFEEAVAVVDVLGAAHSPAEQPSVSTEEELFRALVLGARDFAHKNRLEHVVLGLSGGIDSAVVAVIAAEALGPARVTAVAIPSRYTDPRSTDCARELARSLGIQFRIVDLETMRAAAESTLGDIINGGTTTENIQARLRATILMSLVNRYGGMLLNTGNKTELSLGYATLYGDMAGSLSPLGDVTKPQVMALARWIDAHRVAIPQFILERPPSAELKPNQVDPFDYDQVAPALERVVQEHRTNPALLRSEHKRWQMGVILKVSEKAFGTGRMIPITRSHPSRSESR